MPDRRVQILVLGSGFGGSICSLLLARRGFDVLMIDRATHPRFAIGESSTPIADMILAQLAARFELPRIAPLAQYGTWRESYPQLRRGRKRGFSYFHHRPEMPFQPDARHSNELLVAASSDDFRCDTHWLRADVDQFFAREAVAAGVELWEAAEILGIHRESPWKLVVQYEHGQCDISADFLIDATGAGRALLNLLDIPDEPHRLRTNSRTIYAHFHHLPPWRTWLHEAGADTHHHPFDCDAAALHHVLDGSWMWMLRFDHEVVSAGFAIGDGRPPPTGPAIALEWQGWLERYPSLGELFQDAAITEPPGRLVATGRLQRRARQAAGPGWAALPHTFGFIDPLHSSGIAHTLCGVERLVETLAECWQQTRLTHALAEYERILGEELDFIDQLVHSCYLASRWFRLFVACDMLYFTAVTTYEARRRAAAAEQTVPRDAFLCADNRDLRTRIDGAYNKLLELTSGEPDEAAQAGFEDAVREAIAPYNKVGLLHPAANNMYRHTAAR